MTTIFWLLFINHYWGNYPSGPGSNTYKIKQFLFIFFIDKSWNQCSIVIHFCLISLNKSVAPLLLKLIFLKILNTGNWIPINSNLHSLFYRLPRFLKLINWIIQKINPRLKTKIWTVGRQEERGQIMMIMCTVFCLCEYQTCYTTHKQLLVPLLAL